MNLVPFEPVGQLGLGVPPLPWIVAESTYSSFRKVDAVSLLRRGHRRQDMSERIPLMDSGSDVVHRCAAGIDISKSDAKVCVRRIPPGKVRAVNQTKVFGSTMSQIRLLREWLVESEVECVAMESTSAYWKPFWDGLDGAGFEVVLSNAQAVKQLRGRKTDIADAAWLAKLAALGMAPVSFVPPREVRDLRLATRTRVRLVRQSTGMIATVEKMLEDTGSKLSVAGSKLLTVSGRAMLDAMCAGQVDPHLLAQLSQLRKTTGDQLVEALECAMRPVHQVLVSSLLSLVDQITAHVHAVDAEIDRLAGPFEHQIGLLCTIPGVDRTLACAIIAETGVDMSMFPTAKRLAAWAGVAPGQSQSAGRSHAVGTRKGNKYLKAALGQAARSAANTKNTYLQARFFKIRARRGEAKAYSAVARSILVSVWAMLAHNQPYRDLGHDYYTRTATTAQKARIQARAEATLERLGVNYTINNPTC